VAKPSVKWVTRASLVGLGLLSAPQSAHAGMSEFGVYRCDDETLVANPSSGSSLLLQADGTTKVLHHYECRNGTNPKCKPSEERSVARLGTIDRVTWRMPRVPLKRTLVIAWHAGASLSEDQLQRIGRVEHLVVNVDDVESASKLVEQLKPRYMVVAFGSTKATVDRFVEGRPRADATPHPYAVVGTTAAPGSTPRTLVLGDPDPEQAECQPTKMIINASPTAARVRAAASTASPPPASGQRKEADATPVPEPPGGCGCRTSGGSSGSSPAWLPFAAGAWLLGKRRKRPAS
jgi:MYXO-CTERM domain-containing protein